MKGISNCAVGDTLYFYTPCDGGVKDTKLRGTVVGINQELIQCTCAEINVDPFDIPIVEKDYPLSIYVDFANMYIVSAEYLENKFHFCSRVNFFGNTRLIRNGK